MRFDFKFFGKMLCCTGGLLALLDYAWFAWDGSNIDYSLAFLIGIFIGAVIGSIRWRK